MYDDNLTEAGKKYIARCRTAVRDRHRRAFLYGGWADDRPRLRRFLSWAKGVLRGRLGRLKKP